jgi:hypothetical protein
MCVVHGVSAGLTPLSQLMGVEHVARSRQVCINWVVEALLVAIYLTEKKDVYIHIRLTWSPEANLPPGACPAEPSAVPTQLNPQLPSI